MKTQNIPPPHTHTHRTLTETSIVNITCLFVCLQIICSTAMVFVLIELLKVTKCPINSISNIHLYLKNIPIIVFKLIYFHLSSINQFICPLIDRDVV